MPVFQTRNYLCVLASILAASAPAAAEEPEEAIARCARIATVGDRILCLETTLRNSAEARAQTVRTEAAELPEADDEVPTAVSDDAQVDPMTAPVTDTSAVVPDTAAAATSTVAVSAGTAAGTVESTNSQHLELGAEQVSKRKGTEDNDPARIGAIIIAHELVLTGRLRLTLDNGQVWQQTTDDDRNIARHLKGEDNIPVEMWRGRSGGYRMYLVPFDRTLRVRRLK